MVKNSMQARFTSD